MSEDQLEADDIQGHVLVGFGGGYQTILGLKLVRGAEAEARRALLSLCDRVATTRQLMPLKAARSLARAAQAVEPLPSSVLMAMGFTTSGCAALSFADLPPDAAFKVGAARDARSLGDESDAQGRPVGWSFGTTAETTPDVVFIFGSGMPDLPDQAADEIRLLAANWATMAFHEVGQRLSFDTEHFGFADGVSQPGVRGILNDGSLLTPRSYPEDDPLSRYFSRPGQPLVWPGQFVYGYSSLDPGDVLTPGPRKFGDRPLLKNGSLLVLRKLGQDVDAFRQAMTDLGEQLAQRFGIPASSDLAGALCVGRWRDGTPLTQSPKGPDQVISGAKLRINGFRYDAPFPPATLNYQGELVEFPGSLADPLGSVCPFSAHIRKVNPRDQTTDLALPADTLAKQMLRRGIPYGKPFDEEPTGQRGLLFMSYQTSIDGQFRQLMQRWVKTADAPKAPSSIDPIIARAPTEGRTISVTLQGRTEKFTIAGDWVRAAGAAYVFMPGIDEMRSLLSGPTV